MESIKTKHLDLEEGKHKFIVYSRGNETYLRSRNLPYHSHIWKEISDKVPENHVLGGGKIEIDMANKTIYVWGHSTVYGLYPTEIVRELLGKELEGFLVEVRESE